MVVVGVKNHRPRTVSEKVARKPEKNKEYVRERLREEKVQSLIRKLKNVVNEGEEEEWARRQGIGQGGALYENDLLGPPVKIFCDSYNIVKENTRI